MLNTLEDVKQEIEDWSSKKVVIRVSESEPNLYETNLDVEYDANNGCTFTMGEEEEYQDAIKRVDFLRGELKKYVKVVIKISA